MSLRPKADVVSEGRAGSARHAAVSVAPGWLTRAATAMLPTAWLFLCLLAGSYQFTVKNFVVPSSAEVGSDVTLICEYEVEARDGSMVPFVKWWFIPRYEADDKPVQLFQRSPHENPDLKGRPGIELAGNGNNIILKKMTHKDSGTYLCEVSVTGYQELRVNKTLAVFSPGTGPQLNISEVADGADADTEADLLLECHADRVTPQPELEITVSGNSVKGVNQYINSTGDGLFSVSANVTVTKADLEGMHVKCELFFVDDSIAHEEYKDEETYNSGLPPTTPASTAVPANLAQKENATEATQPNRSSCSSFSWWLSAAALLMSLQLSVRM